MKRSFHTTLIVATCLLEWASLASPDAIAARSFSQPNATQSSASNGIQRSEFEPRSKMENATVGPTPKGKTASPGYGPTRLQAPPAASRTLRVKVIGSIRRDVYGGPSGGLIGKVEPKAVLVVVKTFKDGPLTWYGVRLESGNMYTNEDPVRSLNQGWILSTITEPEK